MPGVLIAHIGDQHTLEADTHLDWVDGSVMIVKRERDALLEAGEFLMGSLQKLGGASGYPQFATLRREWFAIRRNVNKLGGIGPNTLTPTSTQIDDLFASWADKTRFNAPDQQITRAKYATYDPAQWGVEIYKAQYLYVTLDRDITDDEANTWGGKYRPAENGESEHSPKWIHYPDDLIAPGHVRQKTLPTDTLSAGTKDDVRNLNRIIDVAPGRPDTIIRTRIRQGDGAVILPDRIDAAPFRMTKG